METLSKKLGDTVRLLRTAKGLTQENIADVLHLSHSGCAKIEQGKSDISLSRIADIAKIFDLSAAQLLALVDNRANIIQVQTATSSQLANVQTINQYGQAQEMDILKNKMEKIELTLSLILARLELLEKNKT